MKKRILNNLGLKLLSISLAIVLWFLVVMADNPKDSVTFSNIQVTLLNTELLEEGNKFYEVLEGSDRIRVTVEAPRNVIKELSASDVAAEADISRLTEVNTVPISLQVLNDEVEILDIRGSRDSVRLNVEEKASKWVGVRCTTIGSVAENYIISSSKVDQTRIEISGPISAVERISYAGLEIDVSDATTNVSGNPDIHFYDAEGKQVDDTNIVKNAQTMHVEIEVLATKEVPVEAIPTGTPAEGHLATGVVVCDPPTVLIAGTPTVLADLSKLTIAERELDITDKDGDLVKDVDIRKYLDKVKLADGEFNGIVNVTVYIEPIVERNLTLAQSNITLINLPEGLEWEFTHEQETYRLRISGLDDAVSAVNQAEVKGTIDIGAWMADRNVEELTPGEYEMPVAFTLPGNVEQENEVRVRVNIRELNEIENGQNEGED